MSLGIVLSHPAAGHIHDHQFQESCKVISESYRQSGSYLRAADEIKSFVQNLANLKLP